MSENWLPVPGFERLYLVSDLGSIRSLGRKFRGGILQGSAAGNGYRKVILCRDGRRFHRYVHEVVLTTFVGERPDGADAAHGNGVRDDNRLENLRWDTRSGNFADKITHGTATYGEKHGRRKISAADAQEIRAATGSLRAIGRCFGIGPMQVHRIKTGKNWRSATNV